VTRVKLAAFGEGFMLSETVVLTFFSQGKAVAAIQTSAPNKQYAGSGPATLTDNKSGGTNHQSTAWLGFDSDSIVIDISLEKTTLVSQVLLHVLSNQGAWIFAPKKVHVYSLENDRSTFIKSQTFETAREQATTTKAVLMNLTPIMATKLRVIVYPIEALPEWHAGKGNKAWCFIDEIKFY